MPLKVLGLEPLDGKEVVMYKFIAEMRDGRTIILCEGDKLELFETIMGYFDEGNHISRFTIEQNDAIIKEKVLPPKKEGKIKCLKR